MGFRLGQKQKKFLRLGAKAGVAAGALGGAALGVKTTKDEYQKQKDAEFSRARGELAGDLQSLKTEAGLKKMGGGGLPTASGGVAVGGNVIGADSSGNIMFGAGVQAGRGVVANPNIRRGAQEQLPVGRLTQQQLAPFNAKREGARAVAGVVGGQIGLREAARDVASAGFEGLGGRRGQDPIEDFRQTKERGSRGGSTLVAGATGDERFTARESAAILGRRAKRAIPNPLKFVR
tara:strand:- start:1019 stop:1720 length:702 start_codon:yes stop_codon:yes gene_type:complete